jgi:hypothetical protein
LAVKPETQAAGGDSTLFQPSSWLQWSRFFKAENVGKPAQVTCLAYRFNGAAFFKAENIYQLEAGEEGRRKLNCLKAKDFSPPASCPFIIQEVKLPDTDQKGKPVTVPVLREAPALAEPPQATVSPA